MHDATTKTASKVILRGDCMNSCEFILSYNHVSGDFFQDTFLKNTALATENVAKLRNNASCVVSPPSQSPNLRLTSLAITQCANTLVTYIYMYVACNITTVVSGLCLTTAVFVHVHPAADRVSFL